MSNIPADRRYAVTHEWARADASGVVTVGITDHAQTALGDVVFVELPELGAHIDAGEVSCLNGHFFPRFFAVQIGTEPPLPKEKVDRVSVSAWPKQRGTSPLPRPNHPTG